MGFALSKCSVRPLYSYPQTSQPSFSCSSQTLKSYDVFLNFCGQDTRETFTCHFHRELARHGIRVFWDEKLVEGQRIDQDLFKAISESIIFIAIFSDHYASSKWCFFELVEAMNIQNLTVLPIFYHVDPNHVRNLKGDFGKQFLELAKKANKVTVHEWKDALKRAAYINEFHIESGNESKIIQKIAKYVRHKISYHVAKNQVEIDSFLTRLIHFSTFKPNDVRFIGIWGMGGTGKSFFAEALFKQIGEQFEGTALLEDIGAALKQHRELVRLQTDLLTQLTKDKTEPITYVTRGKEQIQQYACTKKVLVLLNDVNRNEQVEALAGLHDWFGPGSRVILTSRDEQFLKKVDVICEVKELHYFPSLQLLSKYAFEEDQPPDEFMEIAHAIVLIVGGLPLALKEIGTYLSGKAHAVWGNMVESLEKKCFESINQNLKISYDELDDDDQQLFLDAACLIGIDKEYAIDIWQCCGFASRIGIENLIEKSLVKIDCNNKLRMHVQLQIMGRSIICEKSLKCSRIWSLEGLNQVLKDPERTKEVEVIAIKFGEETGLNEFKTDDFKEMCNLRLFQIDNVHLVGDFKDFPSQLILFRWKGCPWESIPINLCLEKAVVLELPCSRLKQVSNGLHPNKFEVLKVLNLSWSKLLTESPDFSRFPNLEILNLGRCIKLEELASSICDLKSLKEINLSECSSLKKLPDSVGSLNNLRIINLEGTNITELPESFGLLENMEELNASHCKELVRLPLSMGKMGCLRTLKIDGARIRELPEDIGELSSLEVLSMSGCQVKCFPDNFGSLQRLRHLDVRGNSELAKLPVSFTDLCSLTFLDASGCNLSEGPTDFDFWKLSLLEKLYVGDNNFSSLTDGIGALSRLEYLNLHNCRHLQSLPELPSSLLMLNVKNCTSLETFPNLSHVKGLYRINISNCVKLSVIPGIEKMKSLPELCMSRCSVTLIDGLKNSCDQGGVQVFPCDPSFPEQGLLQVFPRGSSFPNCFTPLKLKLIDAVIWDQKVIEIRLWNLKQHWKINGVDLLVFTNQAIRDIYVQVKLNDERVYSKHKVSDTRVLQDQTNLCHWQDKFLCELEEGDEILFVIEMKVAMEVKKIEMYADYEDIEQSNCSIRMGDLFPCSYDDDDDDDYVRDRVGSQKGRKLQLLDRRDDYYDSYTRLFFKRGCVDERKKDVQIDGL